MKCGEHFQYQCVSHAGKMQIYRLTLKTKAIFRDQVISLKSKTELAQDFAATNRSLIVGSP